MLSWSEIESNAVAFQRRWKNNPGDERQNGQTFQKDFMEIFGVDWREGRHEFQIRDNEGRLNYIDYLLPGKILIEMKSKGESLIRAYNQGVHYIKNLNPEDQPELLLVCDFDYFEVTNVRTKQTFKKFKLSRLKQHVRMFGVLAGYDSEVDYETDIEVNTDASYMMAKLHDELKEHGYGGQDLELYLVRLLFCLFAEDTGIFEKNAFERYLKSSNIDGSDLSSMLMQLFDVLDTPEESRMPAIQEKFREFRYIDGHVFSDRLPSAWFNQKMRKTLVLCTAFDWSYISPAIFGSMFQGVMDPIARRELGAHYTGEENIMKVIKPLFLDELWDEFETVKTTVAELQVFQEKLGDLVFLDPACGSGNFLIIAYRELRLLEFEVLKLIHDSKQRQVFDRTTFSKVSINQFYGIEIDEFACEIAQLGMILVKHQMDQLVSNWFGINTIDFPIRDNSHIVQGNALRMDWADVVPVENLNYILGNPPFSGARRKTQEQKQDITLVFGSTKNKGNLDYVTCWFKKASELMRGTSIRTAFVATNSISQGDQVGILATSLFEDNTQIDFAYRTFKWSNEARGKAAVHCVIIGFSNRISAKQRIKRIFIPYKHGSDDFNEQREEVIIAENISPYLFNQPNIVVTSRSKPLCDVPEIGIGNKPVDGGNYLFSKEEMEEFLQKEPRAQKYFYPWYGSREFISRKPRYCLYLRNCSPSELRSMPHCMERVNAVREFRKSRTSPDTVALAETPTRFHVENIPESDYLFIPRVSSENRIYIPIGFISKTVMTSDSALIFPDATLYHFGVLTSKAHMAWMRITAGRLKSDYRYSKEVVYNNFPWPDSTEEERKQIEQTARNILNARELYPDDTYADLYDKNAMPDELRMAHQRNNTAVREAYGARWMTEEECQTDLLQRYANMINN